MMLKSLTRAALAVLIAGPCALVLAQLGQRANHAVRNAAEAEAAARLSSAITQGGTVNLLLDRPAPEILSAGWSEPELGSGVWSSGTQASLDLPTPATGGDLEVAFKLEPFLAPGVPAQAVTVKLADQALAQWTLTKPGLQELRLTVPEAARPASGKLKLTLLLPNAAAPSRYVPGSTDPRPLGVKLRSVEVRGKAEDLAGPPPARS